MSFNLAVILSETASASPDKAAAVYAGGRLTYGELDLLSDRLAAGLDGAGLRPGDAVALQLPNIPQFLIAYFGILKAGCAVVPLNVMLKAPEVAFQLGDSRARMLITWEGILGEAAKGAAAAGLSEIYAVTERRAYSVGKPIWGTQTEVWDEAGNSLPRGQDHVGEVVTRGLHVMKGYLDNPEATAEVFTGDWLHTGDLGYFDEDGFLFIVSRKKELIIRGGYNVYPSEIEDVLHSHPAVAEAAVIGIPDERLGEEVMAVVKLEADWSLMAHELIAFCRERMAAYKYPRIIEFRDELPKNTLGKILKRELLPR